MNACFVVCCPLRRMKRYQIGCVTLTLEGEQQLQQQRTKRKIKGKKNKEQVKEHCDSMPY